MTAKIKRAHARTVHKHSHKPKGISHKAFRKVYWPYIPVILIIGLLLSFGSQSGALSSIFRHPDGRVLSYATNMSISGLLLSTNGARTQGGAAPLAINSKLEAAAQAKANDMATRDYWSHDTPEGNPPWIFVNSEGYDYQKLGENLAAGFNDEQSTINGWMASPPHRENLLDSAFSEVGFGFAGSPNYTSVGGGEMTIVVAFYGKPQVLAGQTSAPAASAPASSQPSSQPIPQVAQAPSTTDSISLAQLAPATTNSPDSSGLSQEASRAQLALANLPVAQFGTSLAIMGILAAIGIWFSRHALAVRRAVAYSERFAIRHPMLDIGLLVIAGLSYLLTQTAGFIQ